MHRARRRPPRSPARRGVSRAGGGPLACCCGPAAGVGSVDRRVIHRRPDKGVAVPVPVRLHRPPAVRVSIAVLAFASAAVMSFGSRPAHAANVSCGDTITTDTKLHQDLVNCPKVGILIGADNVTLDLNGHTIDGDGTPDSGCDPNTDFCDIGVAFEGRRGVTVKNGSVRDFEAGVVTFKASRARLLRVSTQRNHLSGFALASSDRILVRNSSGIARPIRRATGWASSSLATSASCTAPSGETCTPGSSRLAPRTA